MQDARNENAATLLAVKHDVLAMLMAAQGWANVITKSAQRRIVGKCLAASLKLINVAGRLGFAPLAKRVIADAQQISLSAARKSKRSHDYRGTGSLRVLRTRAKTLPSAIPLASPSSMAARSPASFASY